MIKPAADSDWGSMDTRHPPAGMSLQPPRAASVDERRLLQAVYRRVFGEAEPVTVGRFTLLERIASGGMGVVFKAYDNQLDRKVAVKFIQVDRAGASARRGLVKEARALARLSHPNVVQVYEVGEAADGELFLAMEFVEGVTLRAWLGSASRRWSEVVDVCLQAADGLAAAHAAGLVHGDFKPDNVMVGTDPSAGVRARVVDFGLAHVGPREDAGDGDPLDLAADVSGTSTLGRGVAGTPAYMAPEQLRGAPLGPAADQFAFCVTLFEALCGARPFAGDTLGELLENVEAQRVAVTEDRSGMPSPLHRLLLRGLAADPGARHPSMRLLAEQLRAVRRRPRRRGVAVVAALGITAATITTLSLWPEVRPPVPVDSEGVALGLARAHALAEHDPSAAVAALDALGGDAIGPAAFVLAEEAALAGIADREWAVASGLSVHGVSGSKLLAFRTERRELVAIDLRTGEETRLLQDVDPPRAGELSALLNPGLFADPLGDTLAYRDEQGPRTLAVRGGAAVEVEADDARALLFSRGGTRAALHRGDRVVVLEVPSGRHLLEVPVPPAPRLHLAFDPEGTHLAVGVFGESPRIWGVDTGTSVALAPSEVAFSAFIDADHLVTAGTRGGLIQWDLVDGTQRAIASETTRHVSLAIAGGWCVTAAADDGIHLRHLATGRLRRFEGESFPVVSPDGRWVAWLLEDGRGRAVELASRTERELSAAAPIVDLAFAEDGSGIVTWADDRTARHWPLHGDPAAVGRDAGDLTDFALDHGGTAVVAAYRSGAICRWNVGDGRRVWCAEESGPLQIAMSPAGAWVATESHDGKITVRDGSDGAVVYVTEASMRGMTFDGEALLLHGAGEFARLDLETGARTRVFETDESCSNISLDPARTRVVGACHRGGLRVAVRIWSLADGRPATDLAIDDLWSPVMLSPEVVVAGGLGHGLTRIDLRTGDRSTVGRVRSWSELERDAAGETVVVGGGSEGIVLYDADADAGVVVPSEGGDASTVGLSGDGTIVAYSLDDGTISFRRREVPREPAALREWIAAHRLVQGRVE